MHRLERDWLYLVFPAKAGIPVLHFPTQRYPGIPAPDRVRGQALRRHDGTSLRLKQSLSVLRLGRRIQGASDCNHP